MGRQLSDRAPRDGAGQMKALRTRLRRLETRFESTMAAARPPCPSPVPLIVAMLDRWGIVRGANESLFEAFARPLGMSCPELRAELMRRAGLNPR